MHREVWQSLFGAVEDQNLCQEVFAARISAVLRYVAVECSFPVLIEVSKVYLTVGS